MDDTERDWNRRSVLKTVGAAGATAAVAGVASGADGTNSLSDPGVTTGSVSASGNAASECGPDSNRDEHPGMINLGETKTYSFSATLDDPCSIEARLLARDSSADLDLYVTLDGREPTLDDYDRSSRSPSGVPGEYVTLQDDEVEEGMELGLLLHAYQGGGEYLLTVEETGGEWSRPEAIMSVDPNPPMQGEETVLDASGSFGREADIDSYVWEYSSRDFILPGGETGTVAGEEATVQFEYGRYYELTLTVTDAEGRDHTTTGQVNVKRDWWDWWPF